MRAGVRHELGGRRVAHKLEAYRVSCCLSPSGTHWVRLAFGQDKHIMRLRAECSSGDRDAREAAMRLGGVTCAHVVMRLRRNLFGSESEPGELPADEPCPEIGADDLMRSFREEQGLVRRVRGRRDDERLSDAAVLVFPVRGSPSPSNELSHEARVRVLSWHAGKAGIRSVLRNLEVHLGGVERGEDRLVFRDEYVFATRPAGKNWWILDETKLFPLSTENLTHSSTCLTCDKYLYKRANHYRSPDHVRTFFKKIREVVRKLNNLYRVRKMEEEE